MKQLIYIAVLLMASGLAACQKDEIEGENGVGDGVALTFASGVDGLTAEALAEEAGNVHLLVFDEAGAFVSREEYAGLKEMSPVKLSLGSYTFAYVTNVAAGAVEGATEGAALEDVALSLPMDENGTYVAPGSVFAGTDEVVVGEDKESDAVLKRIVGRLDVSMEGVVGGTTLERVELLGSPAKARLTGEAAGEEVALEVAMTDGGEGTYSGAVTAFPTSADVAALRFVMNEEGEEKTYEVELQNRLEANKVNTVNVKYNAAVVPHDLTLAMEYQEEWGETMRDSIVAEEMVILDSITLKIWQEEGGSLDLSQVRDYNINMEYLGEEWNYVYLNNAIGAPMEMRGDTLVMECGFGNYAGRYRIEEGGCALYSREATLYVLREAMEVTVTADGVLEIMLPKGADVAEGDAQAMLDLRDALLAAGNSYLAEEWFALGDDIALWSGVEVNEEGRVTGIGWSIIGDYYDESDARMAKAAAANGVARQDSLGGFGDGVFRLPESFANLTELRVFTIMYSYGGMSMESVPEYFKDFTKLEELAVITEGDALPELPRSLRMLWVSGRNLTTLPAALGELSNLVVLSVNEELCDPDGDMTNDSRLTNVEVDLSGLSSLKDFTIVGAPDAEFPESLWRHSGVEKIDISGFKAVRVPEGHSLNSLEEFRVANHDVTAADLAALASTGVETLDINSKAFGANGESVDWIGDLSSLWEIYLTNCGMTEIPASWDKLTGLQYLTVAYSDALTGQLPAGLLERYYDGSLSVYCYQTPNFTPTGVVLEVSPNFISDDGNGGTYTIEVTCNRDWTVRMPEEYPEWQVSQTSGSGNATLTLTLPANTDMMYKGSIVTVWVDDRNEAIVNVSQDWTMAQDSTYMR